MINDFLDNLGAIQYEKMMEKNATKKETFYNSESEGKEFKDTFYTPESEGKEFKDTFYTPEKFWEDYLFYNL